MTPRVNLPHQLDLFIQTAVDNVNEACSHTKVESMVYHVLYRRCCGCGSIIDASTRNDEVGALVAELAVQEEPPFEADDYHAGQFGVDNDSEP